MVTNVEIFENHKKEEKSIQYFSIRRKSSNQTVPPFFSRSFLDNEIYLRHAFGLWWNEKRVEKKKKNHPQSSIPDTVKFILEDSKILRSRGQMPGMLRWSNLMIFMQRACATYVPSISSWIFKLLYDATFFQFFFVGAMASWSRDKNNRIKMELKDV